MNLFLMQDPAGSSNTRHSMAKHLCPSQHLPETSKTPKNLQDASAWRERERERSACGNGDHFGLSTFGVGIPINLHLLPVKGDFWVVASKGILGSLTGWWGASTRAPPAKTPAKRTLTKRCTLSSSFIDDSCWCFLQDVMKKIGILDIYGFEVFDWNSFESLGEI